MSAPVSIALLQAQVAEILRKAHEAKPRSGRRPRAIGFHLGAPWSGPSILRVEGEDLPLFYCASPLAFRVRLVETEALPVPVVLLTDRSRQELGMDVLARLEGGKLRNLDEWRALTDRFGVQKVDPRLRGLRWLPEALLVLDDDELSRPATQALDADEVWQFLLSRLGLTDAPPDLRALLEWTAKAEGRAAFLRLPENARGDYVQRLIDSAGKGADAILHLVASRRGDEAIAAGLICDLLFSSALAADPETARTAGRFEASLLGGVTLTPRGGRAWAEAAISLVQRRLAAGGEEAVNPWLSQAERLLDELKARPLGERSAWLPSAFGARVAHAAEAIGSWLDRPRVAGLPALAEAAGRVRGHGLAQARAAEVKAVEDLLRLSRYLAARAGRRPTGSFTEAAQDYAREGSFVDRARTELADAAPLSGPLRPVADRVLRAVTDLREAESRRFAELLAQWSEHPTAGDPLIPVESILDRVVAPLAAVGPVLLLVLDGLSFAVFRELAADLPHQGWEEIRPAKGSGPFHSVALLPTVTEVCRTSLFCGERRLGDAAEERRSFAAHPALRQQSAVTLPPVLFHKASLNDRGTGLAEKVTAEVERAGRRVVGVVLNAVDDQLPKGRQLVTRWDVGAFRYLRRPPSGGASGRTDCHSHRRPRPPRGTRDRASPPRGGRRPISSGSDSGSDRRRGDDARSAGSPGRREGARAGVERAPALLRSSVGLPWRCLAAGGHRAALHLGPGRCGDPCLDACGSGVAHLVAGGGRAGATGFHSRGVTQDADVDSGGSRAPLR